MTDLGVLAQSTPLDAVEPCLLPCCGLLVVAIALAVYAAVTARRVVVDDDDPFGGYAPARPGEPLAYATPGRRPRRQLVFSPRLRWVIAGGLALAVIAAVGWSAWDYRTRTTTFLLVDATTGKPITMPPTDAYAQRDAAGFESTITQPAPGVVHVAWNHPCLFVVRVPGYREDGSNGTAEVDDDTPPVITLRLKR